MARQKILINKIDLERAIQEIAASCDNNIGRTEFYELIANKLETTSSVVQLRIKEFQINVPLASKKGGKSKPRLPITPAMDSVDLDGREAILSLRSLYPPIFRPIIDNFSKPGVEGLLARIHAKCLDCAGMSQQEIARCQIVDCALHAVRPYQDQLASIVNVEDEGSDS